MSTVDNLIKYFSEEQIPKFEEKKVNFEINKSKQHNSNHHLNYEYNLEKKNYSKNLLNKEIDNNFSNLTNLQDKEKILAYNKIEEIKVNDSEKIIEYKKNKDEILEGNNPETENLPRTPYLKRKKGTNKEIEIINNSNNIEIKQIKEKDNSTMPVFIETIHAKIENSENYLYNWKNNENNNNKNKNINYNRKISFGGENLEEINEESEDNTYKEEEKFLEKEENKRKKEGLNILKEKIKESSVVEIIEEHEDDDEAGQRWATGPWRYPQLGILAHRPSHSPSFRFPQLRKVR